MKSIVSITAAALVMIGISAAPAAAKHNRHHHNHRDMSSHRSSTTFGIAPMHGNNAELMGNSGNSGQGSNSLGHIQGGNSGAGK